MGKIFNMDKALHKEYMQNYLNFKNCIDKLIKEGIITPEATVKDLLHLIKERIELFEALCKKGE